MNDNNTTEFAGIELSAGDTVTVTYEDEFGEMEKTGEIESFMYETSRFMPVCIVFGAHDSVGEDKVTGIEKVA